MKQQLQTSINIIMQQINCNNTCKQVTWDGTSHDSKQNNKTSMTTIKSTTINAFQATTCLQINIKTFNVKTKKWQGFPLHQQRSMYNINVINHQQKIHAKASNASKQCKQA